VVDQQRQAGVPILELSEDVFRGLALKEGPQGLAALVRQPDRRLEQVSIQPEDRWVALDSVADPGNLGTILRTNDAVGGKGVILLDQSTDPYDPAAVRASMGAIFSQQIIEADLAEFSGWKRDRQVTVVGTSDRGAVDYQEYRYPNALVLLMGSERHGLQPQHEAICDTMVRIPMVGRSDSLNLAVATAVILYEIFNQSRGVDA
jgi:TrmH family RNA methyltransferase